MKLHPLNGCLEVCFRLSVYFPSTPPQSHPFGWAGNAVSCAALRPILSNKPFLSSFFFLSFPFLSVVPSVLICSAQIIRIFHFFHFLVFLLNFFQADTSTVVIDCGTHTAPQEPPPLPVSINCFYWSIDLQCKAW